MPIGPFTKTAQDVIDRVKRQFGDESGAQVTDNDIISWINSGQQEINRQNRIIKDKATTPTVIGTRDYTFPTPRILQIELLQYNGRPLDYMKFNEAQEYVAYHDPLNTQTGTPIYWWEWGGSLELYPTPDAVGTLTLYYVKYPDDVAINSDLLTIPDSYFDALVQYCMQQAYEQDDDFTGSSIKGQQVKESLQTLALDSEGAERQYYPTITILDEDGYY
jgi:hypothetical protein